METTFVKHLFQKSQRVWTILLTVLPAIFLMVGLITLEVDFDAIGFAAAFSAIVVAASYVVSRSIIITILFAIADAVLLYYFAWLGLLIFIMVAIWILYYYSTYKDYKALKEGKNPEAQ